MWDAVDACCVFQARGEHEADVKRKVAGTLCSMSASCSPEKRGGKITPACREIECFSLSRPWGKSHYTNRELTFSNLSFIPPQQIATVSAIPAKTLASNVSVFAAALSVFSLSSLEVGFSIQKGKMTSKRTLSLSENFFAAMQLWNQNTQKNNNNKQTNKTRQNKTKGQKTKLKQIKRNEQTFAFRFERYVTFIASFLRKLYKAMTKTDHKLSYRANKIW